MEHAHHLSIILDCLSSPQPDNEQLEAAWRALESFDLPGNEGFEEWLMACSALRPTCQDEESPNKVILDRLIESLHKKSLANELSDDGWFETLLLEALLSWYQHLGPQSRSRAYLLAILARDGSPDAYRLLAEILVEDPPGEILGIDLIFGTIFQRRSRHSLELFPRLFDGLSRPDVASAILDLANFLFREGYAETHPASDVLPQLQTILKGIVGNLSRIEAGHRDESRSPDEVHQQVVDSIGLGVSICDTIALTRYEPAKPVVMETLELSHRRLRCEAAWAAARLGEEIGKTELIQLAAEPVARLRVLSYAEELGFLDSIDPIYVNDVARAEAELCVWLAQPTQMGLAPTEAKLLDETVLSWPGSDDPETCYLFEFKYNLGRGVYENIGIAGPVTHAVTADLRDLSPHDIYAFYAGATSEHEEIQEQPVEELVSGYDAEIARLTRRLKDEGLDQIEPRLFGMFFGDRVLVADAQRNGAAGLAITDRVDTHWLTRSNKERWLTPPDAFALYKGRKLLRAFNPDRDEALPAEGDNSIES